MPYFEWKRISRTYPVGNYIFKANNRNTRTRCKTCSKLTIKIPRRRRSSISIVNFEQVNAGWVKPAWREWPRDKRLTEKRNVLMFNNRLCRKTLWNFYFYFRNIRWTERGMARVTAIQLTVTVITHFSLKTTMWNVFHLQFSKFGERLSKKFCRYWD